MAAACGPPAAAAIVASGSASARDAAATAMVGRVYSRGAARSTRRPQVHADDLEGAKDDEDSAHVGARHHEGEDANWYAMSAPPRRRSGRRSRRRRRAPPSPAPRNSGGGRPSSPERRRRRRHAFSPPPPCPLPPAWSPWTNSTVSCSTPPPVTAEPAAAPGRRAAKRQPANAINANAPKKLGPPAVKEKKAHALPTIVDR